MARSRPSHSRPVLALTTLAALAIAGLAPRNALAGEPLRVVVPEKDNLQYLVFWAAKAGGYFAQEGVDVEVVVPPTAPKAEGTFERGEVDAAVLPPPMYLRLLAAKKPIVIAANLLRNDTHDIVVRRDVADAKKIGADAPLAARTEALRGMRIGFLPASHGQLVSLLKAQGLDADKDATLTVLLGRDMDSAFKESKVDAVYAAPPQLDKVVARDHGVVLVDQAGGEVKSVAAPQIHVFAVGRPVLEKRKAVVTSAVRALGRAAKALKGSPKQATEALVRELPSKDRSEIEAVVRLYSGAVPETIEPRADALGAALDLVPEGVPRPDLAGVDVASFVATDLAKSATIEAPAGGAARLVAIAAGVLTAVLVAVGIVLARRKKTA